MDIVDKAIVFAVNAHSGAVRKGTKLPYIVHPIEACAIAASITDDKEIIAAAVLHDIIEDTDITEEELAGQFGARCESCNVRF
ncbi:MAG: HD domain-containing protein [Candidatus Neoclostridium sp.]